MTHIFIVNPYAGKNTFADELREKLAEIPNFNYFIFNTRCAGYEIELVKRIRHIFQDEKLRFYCCGGSGTMTNMLNGLEETDTLKGTEVAFYPCGLTNDFLKIFGKDEHRFYDIHELIHGDVISVDYIKTNYSIALNTVSFGLDANTLSSLEDYRTFRLYSSQIPYTLAVLHSVFLSKSHQYEFYLDDKRFEGTIREFCIGNGYVLGGNLYFAKGTCATDGIGQFCYVQNKNKFHILSVIRQMQNKNIEKLSQLATLGECSRFRVRRTDGSPITYNCDGNLIRNADEINAFFVKEGLSLVVPKGVKI